MPKSNKPPANKDSLLSPLHLDVRIVCRIPAEALEQVAALKVFVWMHNRFELCRRHDALVLGFFDLVFVQVLKHPAVRVSVTSQKRKQVTETETDDHH